MTASDDKFVEDGIAILRSLRTKTITASLGASPWKVKLPEFPVNGVSNEGFRSSENVAAIPEAFQLPTFDGPLAASPDGQFVSMLSSPCIPECSSRGSGSEIGKLFQRKVTADADDGYWDYTGAYGTDQVIFGNTIPIP